MALASWGSEYPNILSVLGTGEAGLLENLAVLEISITEVWPTPPPEFLVFQPAKLRCYLFQTMEV